MICFAILAHDKPEVLQSQIRNIKKYNPNAQIVLYNGGKDKKFADNLGIPVCPYSRPLQYGRLERYLLDTAIWLEETIMDYDYLVSVDSDVLFLRHGYEAFLQEALKEYDLMGVNMVFQSNPSELPHWVPGQMMWKEWELWQPFFGTDGFCGTLNPMQVYTHEVMAKIIADLDHSRMKELEKCLAASSIFALEEMLLPTLAIRAGGRAMPYPLEIASFTRCGDNISLTELQVASNKEKVYFVHPVRRGLEDPVWQAIICENFERG
ncbi:hypothetical protein [Paenibacillus thermotolerans]|uniref:hypothetical protein n=1 Tax=Paenibacillus thermotolerans TaxID=3027807 RepID=UPI0023686386|nr:MULTISPECIES: hypothetical protein [unclassified Paenibacillus]